MDALVLKILIAIVLFALPAWITRIRRRSSSRLSSWAFILIAISELMQIAYVVRGATIIDLFDHFLIMGLAICVIGTILSMICQSRTHSEAGYIFTGATTSALWFYLGMIH